MANDTLDYPTPDEIRELFSPEKLGQAGEVITFRMMMGEEPLQIRVYMRTERSPEIMVRTVITDGGTSYLAQYGGKFNSPEATALFINAIIQDVREK